MSTQAGAFRKRLLAGEWLAGAFINLGSAVTAEIAGRSGFDWLLLDYEHGPGSDETLLSQLQALGGTAVTPLVRIAANEAPRFKRVLDLGSAGVMVPYVTTVAEAQAAVAAGHYPPRGIRGVSKFNRAAGFGQDFEAYFARSGEETTIVVQIENMAGVDASEAIAAVEGVDALFVGPLDLSTNLGIVGQVDHPRLVEARRRVAAAARRAGKAAGILLTAEAQIEQVRAEGFTLVTFGSDGGAVATGLRQAATALKKSR